MLEKGRVCLKISGREADKYCVVVEPQDNTFVLITGPKTVTRVKRRKVNVLHIEPTEHVLDIAGGKGQVARSLANKGIQVHVIDAKPRLEGRQHSKISYQSGFFTSTMSQILVPWV